MGERTLQIVIWQRPTVMDSFEIVALEMDDAGGWSVFGSIGPYLSKEEAEADLPNISKKSFK